MQNFVVINPNVEKVLCCFEDIDSDIFRHLNTYREKESFRVSSHVDGSLSKFLKENDDINSLRLSKTEIKEHKSNFGLLIYIFTRDTEDPESKYIPKNHSFSIDYHQLKQLLNASKSEDEKIEEIKVYTKGKVKPVVLKNSEICTDMISFLDKKLFLNKLNIFRVIHATQYPSLNNDDQFLRHAVIQFGKTLLLYIEKFFPPVKHKSIQYRIAGNIMVISGFEEFSEARHEAWDKEVAPKGGNKYNNYEHWLSDKTRHLLAY